MTQVDFGYYDAESDDRLLDYFLVTGQARRAATGAYLVLGRKGAGKTAIFKHLASTLGSNGAVVELDLEGYVFQFHKGLIEQGVDKRIAYTMSWRILFVMSMYLQVRRDLKQRQRRSGDRSLEEIGLSSNANPVFAMLRWLRQVRRVELPNIEGFAGLGSLELADPSQSVLDLRTVNAVRAIEAILVDHCKEHSVTVLVDRLDDAWDGSEASKELITGAVRATRDLSKLIHQTGPAPVVTFLRTDIWEALRFNDKNKMPQHALYLDWTDDNLVGVIERRINATTDLSPNGTWADVFTSDEMRQRHSSSRYILKRTLGRPRDVVAFASMALRSALDSGHSLIEKDDIYSAENEYSRHVLNELQDEISEHVSDFARVINSVKALRQRSFTPESWFEACAAQGLDAADAKESMNQLFEASAVGVLSTGGGGGGSRTVFRYQDRLLQWEDATTLQVHPAFTRELRLKDS